MLALLPEKYPLTLNDTNFKGLIEEASFSDFHYDNWGIADKNVPKQPKGQNIVTMRLLVIRTKSKKSKTESYIDQSGFRWTTFQELLTFAKEYRNCFKSPITITTPGLPCLDNRNF